MTLNFTAPATEAELEALAARLRERNFEAVIVQDGAEAKAEVLKRIPEGASIHSGKSKTLEDMGLFQELMEDERYDFLRRRIFKLDRNTQRDEMRRLGASPDVMLGSVHAVTETGSLIVASMSGSQLGPYVSGAAKVILVVGTQKIVPDLEEGLRRIDEYALPLEDARAQQAYGVHSAVNKVLIVNREINPGRITVVLIDEVIGF